MNRFAGLVNLLRVAAAAAFGLGVAGALGLDAAASGAVAVVVAAPLVRVGWLAVRWARKGDVRFAALALALLAVAGSGFLLG